MLANQWMRPAEDSLLSRWLRRERGLVPAGGLLCGLRTDDAGVPGVRRLWRYEMSTIDGTVLVFGKADRYALQIEDPVPIDHTVDPRADFRVWRASLADGSRTVTVEIAADRRDAYKLMDSALLRR
jgi:hypothetical protein